MRKRTMVLAGILVAFGLSWAGIAHADANFQNASSVNIPAGRTVDQTVFAAGQTVDIAGTVNGDVYCAGQSITISGTVNGDVLCAGQNVEVTGTVNGSARIMAQTVALNGEVTRSMSAAGQTVSLAGSSRVGGDAAIAGQTVTLDGTVGRDAILGATLATINGTVGRDAQVQATQVGLGASATIDHNLTYASPNNLSQASGASVRGTVSHQALVEHRATFDITGAAWHGFGFALLSSLSLLLLTLVLILCFPQLIHAATEVAVREPLKTFLVGLIASIVVPIVLFAVGITVIGLPLALLAGLVWLLMSIIALPLSAYYLGSLLLSKSTNNAVWIMLGGMVILLVSFLIPLINILAWLVSLWFGLGMLLLHVPRLPRPNYQIAASRRV